jgi:hypothetical protein
MFPGQQPTTPQPAPPQAGIMPPTGPMQPQPAPQQLNVGGIMSIKPLSTVLAQEATDAAKQEAQSAQQLPEIEGSRRPGAQALEARAGGQTGPGTGDAGGGSRAKKGEYTPQKLAEIQKQGGSSIYMMLFATKARQAKALLADVMVGTGTEKPWTITPTPSPDLPPPEVEQIQQAVQQMVFQAEMSGQPMMIADIRAVLQDAKEQLESPDTWRRRASTRSALRKRWRTAWSKAVSSTPWTSSWTTSRCSRRRS